MLSLCILSKLKSESLYFKGQYSCTVSNDYGSVTATLSVNPDVNALRHRGLNQGCCRKFLQKQHREKNGTLNSNHCHQMNGCSNQNHEMSL